MKSLKLLLSITLVITLTLTFNSCEPKGPIFEKYLKMKDNTWDRFDQKFFEIPIADIEKSLDITFVIRHTAKFQYDNLPVYIILTTPAGAEQIREIKIPVRENGKMIADSTGSLHEIHTVLWKSISLAEKGKYKISIENMIPKIQTEGIDEIGIVVTESKQR
jgi:gliding motility-associated lipoprotein GldH